MNNAFSRESWLALDRDWERQKGEALLSDLASMGFTLKDGKLTKREQRARINRLAQQVADTPMDNE